MTSSPPTRHISPVPGILWGSDYPHFDSTYPGAYTAAKKTFDATGAELSAQIVVENPKR